MEGAVLMPKFEPIISAGNLITIAFGFIALFGLWVDKEVAFARQEIKLESIEKRVEKNEDMSKDIQTIKVDVGKVQANQNIMLQLLRDRG